MRVLSADEDETIDLIWEDEFVPKAPSAPLSDDLLGDRDGCAVARIPLKKKNVSLT